MGGAFFLTMSLFEAWRDLPAFLAGRILTLAIMSSGFGILMALAFRYVLLPFNIWRVHRQNPTYFRDLVMTVDAEGFIVQGLRSTTSFPWAEIRGFKESRRVFLISKSKSLFFTIPKRDLTAEVANSFRELLSEKLIAKSGPRDGL